VKKDQGDVIRNYREITIMPTLYKIYAPVLGERLREEVEEVPQNQTGFRRGMRER